MPREHSVPRKARDGGEHSNWLGRALWLLKETYRTSLKWIFLPLLGALLSTFLIGRIVTGISGPALYKIYVVGDFGRPAAQSIFQAFRNQHLELGGVTLKVDPQDDHGDPDQAKRIAAKLAHGKDTLLVIGHINGSQTKLALPSYLGAKPPVPVILAVETTPNLAPPKVGRSTYDPIFRLSPTDDRQARSIVLFIKNAKKEPAVWVVVDTDNAVYSNYLASTFVRTAQREQMKIVLWSTNMSPPTAQAIHDLHINWVFFAGRRENALILIHQLRAMDGLDPLPNVMLSDSSANQDLIERDKEGVEGVYVASQVTADQYNKEVGIQRPDGGQSVASVNYNKNAGYNIYGARALKVVQLLLERASDPSNLEQVAHTAGWAYRARRLLRIQRVQDARTILAVAMEAAQYRGEPFILDDGTKITFDVDRTGEYGEAGEDGIRSDDDATFHIWQVKDGIFVDVSEPHDS